MDKQRVLITGLLTLAVSLPGVSLAGKPDKNKSAGFLNGKPFATLNEKVEANKAIFGTLASDMGSLDQTLAGIRADIAGLSDEVDGNSADIAALQSSLADVVAASAATRAEVDALRQSIATEIETVNDLIVALETEVAASAADAIALSAELQAAIAEITEVSEATNATLLEILTLNAAVTSITASIASIESTITGLEQRLDQQEISLQNLELQLAVGGATAMADVVAITFETLNADCSADVDRTFSWSVNGEPVATSTGDANLVCGCEAPVTQAAADLSSVTLAGDGSDSISFESPIDNAHLVGWSRAVLADAAGNSTSVCLFDEGGGDCTEANLCDAGFTGNAISETVNF